jgi:tRNA(fMet)-specific endonuclease VapC
VRYLLDTNACIALINEKGNEKSGEKSSALRARLNRALTGDAELYVSAVAAFELWYGVAKSARQEANAKRVETFFAGPVSLLAFDEEDARSAGKIRAALEAAGKTIGAYDLLMAGQAMRHKLTLITANAREFGRVKGLLWEDWTRP